MNHVAYVCDTETTGLDPVKNDVIEVSFWRLSDDEQKTWYLRPFNPQNIEDKALKISGHKKDDVLLKTAFGKETFKDPAEVISEIEVWIMNDNATIEDRVFIGQNPTFDYEFLSGLWEKAETKDTFPFSKFIIDTIQLVRFVDLCTGKKRDRYNLSSLVKDFGVTKQKAHRSMNDVKMTKELFDKIYLSTKEHLAGEFQNKYS